jgi:RecB family exonuclease
MNALSPSQVDNFLECPFRWYAKSVLHQPEPVTVSLAIGRAVHRTLTTCLRAKGAATQAAAAFQLTAPLQEPRVTPEEIEDLSHTFAREELSQVPQDAQADPEIEEERAADTAALADKIEAMCQLWWRQGAPSIEPAAVEIDVRGVIGGVDVMGIIDILDTSGRVIDLKTASKKPTAISAKHALQLTTYAMLQHPGKIDQPARVDTLTKTKAAGFYSHTMQVGDDAARYAERIYPMVAEAISDGIYLPHRSSTLCSKRLCPHAALCEQEFGGTIKP